MRKINKIDGLELILILIPLFFIFTISLYHGFGVESKYGEPLNFWFYLHLFSHHLLIIYLAITVGMLSYYIWLKKLMYYLIVPYFILKLLYTVLLIFRIRIGSGEMWVYIWGIICILTIITGGIFLWANLRKTGY